MKYKPGDKVKIKSLDWYNENKGEDGRVMCGCTGFCKEMKSYCGKELTIDFIYDSDGKSLLGCLLLVQICVKHIQLKEKYPDE